MKNRIEIESVRDDGGITIADLEHAVRADGELVGTHFDLELACGEGADAKLTEIGLKLNRAAGLDGEDVEGHIAGYGDLLGRSDE